MIKLYVMIVLKIMKRNRLKSKQGPLLFYIFENELLLESWNSHIFCKYCLYLCPEISSTKNQLYWATKTVCDHHYAIEIGLFNKNSKGCADEKFKDEEIKCCICQSQYCEQQDNTLKCLKERNCGEGDRLTFFLKS